MIDESLDLEARYPRPYELLENLADALQKEYEIAKKYGGSYSIKLIEGRLLDSQPSISLYVYRYRVTDVRLLSKLSPDVKVKVRDALGKVFEGEVLSIDGDIILLKLNGKPNSNGVDMSIDLAFLLIEQKKKLIAYRDHFKNTLSRLPEIVFYHHELLKDVGRLKLQINRRFIEDLNEEQKKSIEFLEDFIAYAIWGPPGTGKSKVLARIALLTALNGKRVLIATHTHAALDRVLSLIDDELNRLKLRDILDGRIIKIGVIADPTLRKQIGRYEEDSLIEGVVKRRMAEKIEKVDKLREEVSILENLMREFQEGLDKKVIKAIILIRRFLSEKAEERARLSRELRALRKNREEYYISKKIVKNELEVIYNELKKLDASPPLLDRLLPGRLKKKKEELIRRALELIRKFKYIESRIKDIEDSLRVREEQLSNLERECRRVLTDLSPLNEDDIVKLSKLLHYEDYVDESSVEYISIEEVLKITKDKTYLIKVFVEYDGLEGLKTLLMKRRQELEDKSREVEKEMVEERQDIREELRRNALIIASTLTKTITEVFDYVFTSKIPAFDLVLIDESSMAGLGQIWIVCSIAKRAVFFGDPKQLPPITLLEEGDEHHQLMSSSIFDWCGVSAGSSALPNIMLKRQYRMGRKICRLVGELFYGGALISESNHEGEVVFLNTDDLKACDNNTLSKSRINILHAYTVNSLVKEYIKNGVQENEVAVITPYRDQAMLIRHILDSNNLRSVIVGTVHTIQGGEKKVIILDTVVCRKSVLEKSPLFKISERLFSTAMSRAKERLVIIASRSLFSKSSNPILQKILRNSRVETIMLYQILPLRPERIALSNREEVIVSTNEYYQKVMEDISKAERSIIIVSPYIKNDILRAFASKTSKKIIVYTNAEEARKLVDVPRNVELRTRDKRTHVKLIIIDERIVYSGSINPLSPTGSEECMCRWDDPRKAREFMEKLNITS